MEAVSHYSQEIESEEAGDPDSVGVLELAEIVCDTIQH